MNKQQSDLFKSAQDDLRKTVMGNFGCIAYAVFAIIVFAIIQCFRNGFFTSDYLLLILFSLLSFVSILFVTHIVTLKINADIDQQDQVEWTYSWKTYLAVGILSGVAELFFAYITFWRGLWPALPLLKSFSFVVIIKCLFFTVIGIGALKSWFATQRMDNFLNRLHDNSPLRKYKEQHPDL